MKSSCLKRMSVILLILILCILAAVFLSGKCNKDNENFKVLGALARQKDMYYQCLSKCEKSDPALRLTPTKGSMMCQAYCDSTITDIVRRGGPFYSRDEPVATVPVITRIDQAYSLCGDGTKGNSCRQNLSTAGEIEEKCRQNCAYSTLPQELCMKDCSNVLAVNKTSGWSWK